MSGPEYGFFSLPDTYTTGSSLMPQKKNPDALELIRGKAARVDGAAVRMLALMKGVPTGYQKDLQEDKEAVFDAADATAASVAVMTGVVGGLGLNREAMRRSAGREEMMAAGLAVALAREGMPFRKAHGLVGSLVAEAHKTMVSLQQLVQEAQSEVAQETDGRQISWKIGQLPACYGDRSMLRLAMINLIANAVKFTRTRAQAEIEIAATNHNPDQIVVFVRDNGVGFDMKYVNKLFGVFQRLHRNHQAAGHHQL